MIVKQEKVRPATKYMDVVSRICDICKEAHCQYPGEWNHERREETDTEVTMKVVHYDYDGGGRSVSHTYDICPECFANKLAPWIEAQAGAKARLEECDW